MSQNNNNHYRPKKLTTDEIREGCVLLTDGDEHETRICVINEEFRQGLDFIKTYDASVTIFGSARTPETDPYYDLARTIARRIVQDLGYAIVTGGGPGMMEAGNRGAHDARGRSIGFSIKLPMEQTSNPYMTDELSFYFFFSRKVCMTYASEAYIYMPGGFGTLDELFEILTLVQTEKISRFPIILVGEDFWRPLDAFIKKTLLEQYQTISPEDLDLYIITDDVDLIIETIKKSTWQA
ncbi:MAG: TIGR00730 family Rossman fold protein [Candidatus Pacebacteria bacterium]|nr:TIGR00730 family Rossman fold protein [Candidatus Paceibacterota bacterium]